MSEFKERLEKIKVRNMAVKHKSNTNWTMEKKIEVVSQFLVLGNMRQVAAITGVSYGLMRQWKMQPWWAELEAEIRQTQNIEIDTKLSKIVDKSLDGVLDRIENGEYVWDAKKGKVARRPAKLSDVAKVSTEMLTKRELLRGNATERKEVTQMPIKEQLAMLAAEFARWQIKSQPAPLEMVDIVEIEDVQIKGDQENQMAESDDLSDEVYDSDEQDGLGPLDESESNHGSRVD